MTDEDSIFNYYREAIRVRNNFPVIARGQTVVDEALSDDRILVITKTSGDYDDVTLVYNFADEERTLDLSGKDLKKIKGSLIATAYNTDEGSANAPSSDESGSSTPAAASFKSDKLIIPPHTILVLQ